MVTSSLRIDNELFKLAKKMGALQSRSAAQQVAHWAKIGLALESSPSVSPRDVVKVLTGQACYDDLNAQGQAIVRATWNERIAERLENLDLAEEFTKQGRTWTELDDDGNVITRNA